MTGSGDGRPIIFAPDVGREVGGGHLIRSLALALALIEQGWSCLFAVPPDGRARLERFSPVAMPIIELASSNDTMGQVEALMDVAGGVAPAAMVLDGYGWRADLEAELRAVAPVLIVLDDLADRPHLADVLIDSGPGDRTQDYVHLTPPGCLLLLGPKYALLRPEFDAPAKPTRERVQRILVSFGLSDVGGIASRIVGSLAPHCAQTQIDVAVASDALSLPELRGLATHNSRVDLYEDATDMVGLMGRADLAIGAGGSMTWERCSLGLPTIAVIVAENQRKVIESLARDGVLIAIDGADPLLDQHLIQAFQQLQRPELRHRLSLASRGVCDGAGARRAAQAVEAVLNRVHPG